MIIKIDYKKSITENRVEKYIFKQHWKEGRLVIWNNYIYPHARKITDKGLQREFIRYALNKY